MYAIRRLIDRCEDGEAASLRKKCGDFCRGLYDNTVAAAGESASHTSSYLLAAMVDLHADKLELEGGKMTAGERDDELEKAKKVHDDMNDVCMNRMIQPSLSLRPISPLALSDPGL